MSELRLSLPDRLGVHDMACPICGPSRRSPGNRTRKVLRIWKSAPGFVTYHCVRCGIKGYQRERGGVPAVVRPLEWRVRPATDLQTRKALQLWRSRLPVRGSIAEKYLRDCRGYRGEFPCSLGFLPTRGPYAPALIAAFGTPTEVEPGVLELPDENVIGIHLTRLLPDGSDRERSGGSKIMLGRSIGHPIVLSPWTDGLALVVTEGIEDCLSAHESTGLCGWAAGCASRLPALANAIPSWAESVTILADNDTDGRRHALALAQCLSKRKIEIRLLVVGVAEAKANA